ILVELRLYRMRLSRLAYSLQMSSVASVEALSEIISSKSANVCARIDSSVFVRYFSALYTPNPILTRGVRVISSSSLRQIPAVPQGHRFWPCGNGDPPDACCVRD